LGLFLVHIFTKALVVVAWLQNHHDGHPTAVGGLFEGGSIFAEDQLKE
jgi:hypothetical protein